jgi:hypothetical protein
VPGAGCPKARGNVRGLPRGGTWAAPRTLDATHMSLPNDNRNPRFLFAPPKCAALVAFYHPYALRPPTGDSS